MWEAKQERAEREEGQRENAESDFRSDVVMKHGVEFASEVAQTLDVVRRGREVNQRINHVGAVAEEEDGEDGYDDQADEGGKCGALPVIGELIDLHVVLQENRLETLLLSFAPAVFSADFGGDFAAGNVAYECRS